MTILTIIVLAAYLAGVWVAYFQLLRWHGKKTSCIHEAQVLFMLSMLSWFIYPVYWMAWLIKCDREE